MCNTKSIRGCEDFKTNYTSLEKEDLGRICGHVNVFMEYKHNSDARTKKG